MSLALVPKLTGKQEKFCNVFIESGNASEAYRQSYRAENMSPAVICTEASNKLKIPKVSLRLEQLRADHAKRHEVTVDSLTKGIQRAIDMAEYFENPMVMISGFIALAKLHGLYPGIRKVETPKEIKFTTSFIYPPRRDREDNVKTEHEYEKMTEDEYLEKWK